MTNALLRLREALLLALLALLPFHALLVTVGTRAFAGPGHAPLGALAAWKEGVLLLVLSCACVELLLRKRRPHFDVMDAWGVAFLLAGAAWCVARPGAAALYGVKYDLVPVAAFLLLRRVDWSQQFLRRACAVLLVAGIIAGVYGLLTLRLPMAFFRFLGYADLHSLYVPSGSLPPFHQIGESMLRRVQSGFAGPNQLGLWMLLPWSVAWAQLLQSPRRKLATLAIMPVGLAIAGSLSRAAWIGAVIVVVALFVRATSGAARRRVLASAAGAVVLGVGMLFILAPSTVVRMASSADHIRRPVEAVRRIVAHPWGTGLGTAGPASNRISDACVDLPAGADASWAAAHPALCVFVAGVQVQPAGKACTCPVLPENWYLQIGVELGIVGMLLFIGLLLAALWALARRGMLESDAMFAAVMALSAAALVLHAWEDAAVAWTSWILAAAVLRQGTSNAGRVPPAGGPLTTAAASGHGR